MIGGSVYDMATGEVLRNVYAPTENDVAIQCEDGEGYLTEVVAMTDYIKDGEIVPRPAMGITMSGTDLSAGEVLRIDGIPAGTTVRHPNGELVVDDGFIEWAASDAGEYWLFLVNFPYREEQIHAIVRDA